MVSLMLEDHFRIREGAVCGIYVSGDIDRNEFNVEIEKQQFDDKSPIFTIESNGEDKITIKCKDRSAASELAHILMNAGDLLKLYGLMKEVSNDITDA